MDCGKITMFSMLANDKTKMLTKYVLILMIDVKYPSGKDPIKWLHTDEAAPGFLMV